MILKKIKVEDLLYDANTDIMETNLKLSDYDWMHYQLTGKFRTEEMGTLEVTFEFIGIAACDMTVIQTFKEKSREMIYEFSTDIYKKHLIAFMQKHIASWDDEYAFSGEEEIVSFFNEVLETGTLKEIKDNGGMTMAKIFRFSGYLIQQEIPQDGNGIWENFQIAKLNTDVYQQLHIEEGEEFEPDGELEPNCDLALLTRHFKKEPVYSGDRPLPKPGERYRHFKLGKIVRIIGISRHTESEEISVVYECEEDIWNRPLSMFLSKVDKAKYPDAKQEYRFEKI